MRQAGALFNALASVIPGLGELTDLQRNSQPPVPSVSKCAHFQLASLLLIYEEQLGRVCAVLREPCGALEWAFIVCPPRL